MSAEEIIRERLGNQVAKCTYLDALTELVDLMIQKQSLIHPTLSAVKRGIIVDSYTPPLDAKSNPNFSHNVVRFENIPRYWAEALLLMDMAKVEDRSVLTRERLFKWGKADGKTASRLLGFSMDSMTNGSSRRRRNSNRRYRLRWILGKRNFRIASNWSLSRSWTRRAT